MNLSMEDRRQLLHYVIRGVILSGFAFLIVYYVRTDNLTLYIAPRMAGYVKLSALGLYAAAVYQLYAALQLWMGRKSEAECDCDHSPSPSILKNFVIYGLFIFPLALGFFLPDTLMGSSLAAKKGMNLGGSPNISRTAATDAANAGGTVNDSPGTAANAEPSASSGAKSSGDPLDALFPSDIYTEAYAHYGKQLYKQDLISVEERFFIETLTTLDLYREQFIGKTVEISGFVYREGPMGDQRFAVSRFAMNCCSADALPYGMMISYPKAANYDTDTWIKVTGIFDLAEYNGNEIISLKARKIERIEAPESPYVYPDYDFGL